MYGMTTVKHPHSINIYSFKNIVKVLKVVTRLKGVISFPIPETSNVQRMPEE
jgi:hypothetical protein